MPAATRQRKSTPAELAASEASSAPDPFDDLAVAGPASAGPDPGLEAGLDLDLDAVLPAQAEAVRRTTTVRVEGRVIEFPLMQFWPLRAAHLAEHEGDLLGCFRCVLDEDDVEFLADLPGDKMNAIMDHLLKLSGVAPGESSRSGRSSRSTPRR